MEPENVGALQIEACGALAAAYLACCTGSRHQLDGPVFAVAWRGSRKRGCGFVELWSLLHHSPFTCRFLNPNCCDTVLTYPFPGGW